ncbi:MAG: DUF2911 domain-containing protein [Flavobacteriaceae bacterium]|mgnify:FL=1|jgi:hypothetical protein|nr:DUF2911 domain-containing protein [Flavobacteriaceae bacterium]MDG1961488.1 DUF2911 domain-containing protein [Flavobacteriaceae bacterium]
MKKLLLLLALSIGGLQWSNAQILTPAASPEQTILQKVGLTDVTVNYSRPSMRGRAIFGDLVAFDALWRTGANKNTTITFSDAVVIGGGELAAGTYAIYTKPSEKTWEVYFYTDTENWGNPANWETEKVAARLKITPQPINNAVETFTISFDQLTDDSVMLSLFWEHTYVAVPITFMTDKQVMASIEQTFSGPSAADYYNAAVYYLNADNDMALAKEWIDKAIEMRTSPAFWYHRQQALIYAKAGDKKGALKAANLSRDLAAAAGNKDYVAMNEKSIKEWSDQ